MPPKSPSNPEAGATPPAWLKEFLTFYESFLPEDGRQFDAAVEEYAALGPEVQGFFSLHLRALELRALATVTKRLALIQDLAEKLLPLVRVLAEQGNIHSAGFQTLAEILEGGAEPDAAAPRPQPAPAARPPQPRPDGQAVPSPAPQPQPAMQEAGAQAAGTARHKARGQAGRFSRAPATETEAGS